MEYGALPVLVFAADEYRISSYYEAKSFDPSSLGPNGWKLTRLFTEACERELGLILGDDHPTPSWLLMASYG
jgi:hypothetical protein